MIITRSLNTKKIWLLSPRRQKMRPGEDAQKRRLEEHFNIMKWQQRLQHTEKLHLVDTAKLKVESIIIRIRFL